MISLIQVQYKQVCMGELRPRVYKTKQKDEQNESNRWKDKQDNTIYKV